MIDWQSGRGQRRQGASSAVRDDTGDTIHLIVEAVVSAVMAGALVWGLADGLPLVASGKHLPDEYFLLTGLAAFFVMFVQGTASRLVPSRYHVLFWLGFWPAVLAAIFLLLLPPILAS